MADQVANAQTRQHWTRKLNAQSQTVIKAIEDLLIMVAEASEAGVRQPDIAYNIPDMSQAAIVEGRGTGIHSTAITPKVKAGQAIKDRRKNR
jgi:hypothetical protein